MYCGSVLRLSEGDPWCWNPRGTCAERAIANCYGQSVAEVR